jgi:Transposase DDE domain
MFRDGHRGKVWDQIRQRDLPAFNHLLTREAVVEAAVHAGVTVGDGPLSVLTLTWLAVSAALHIGKCFADVLVVGLKVLSDQPGWNESTLGRQCKTPRRCQDRKRGKQGKNGRQQRKKHDPRGNWLGSVTEEAFVQARKRLPLSFWTWLLIVLAQRFEAAHPEADRWKQFRLLMLDGTHVPLARWKRLIEHFGTAKNGKKKAHNRPQARMVMLALAKSRVPWRYEATSWSTHEQAIAHRLLKGLRANDLVLMDRGFWSYALFWQIAQQGAFFAIRLRNNLPLKTLKRLGAGDRLVEWKPHKKARHRGLVSWDGLPGEITLRVVDYKIRGFRKSAVVTNVLDPNQVSQNEWVQLAGRDAAGHVIEAGLYHRRWGIETLFKELKVHQGLDGELRGRTPESIHYEIAGHVLLYLLTRWLMVEAADAHQADPAELSFVAAQRELHDMRQTLLTADPRRIRQFLLPRLLERIAQHRIAFRPGRHYPRIGETYQLGKYRKRSKTRKLKA